MHSLSQRASRGLGGLAAFSWALPGYCPPFPWRSPAHLAPSPVFNTLVLRPSYLLTMNGTGWPLAHPLQSEEFKGSLSAGCCHDNSVEDPCYCGNIGATFHTKRDPDLPNAKAIGEVPTPLYLPLMQLLHTWFLREPGPQNGLQRRSVDAATTCPSLPDNS